MLHVFSGEMGLYTEGSPKFLLVLDTSIPWCPEGGNRAGRKTLLGAMRAQRPQRITKHYKARMMS